MRYWLRLLCVCALGVLPLVGCGETAGEPCQGDCPCQRPLDHYWNDPTWEEAIAAAEEFVAQLFQDTGSCDLCSASTGRCGELRYVETGCAFEGRFTQYFDTSGTLVAATVCSDGCGDVCPGACCVDYGFRPECELEQEQDFCDQDD